MRSFLSVIVLAFLAACQTVPPPPGFTAQQVTVLQKEGFQKVEDHWELGLADRLLFATDEDRLAEIQVKRLRDLANTLTAVGIHGLTIEGNTDSTGSADYNLVLSERRANAVRQAMIGDGMSEQSIRVVALGESHPVESNGTAAGRQENRRVVIVVSAADAN